MFKPPATHEIPDSPELAASVPGLTDALDALLKARAALLEQFRRLDDIFAKLATFGGSIFL